jgi:queuosine precursor transporter
MVWLGGYVLLIVAINYGFSVVPLVALPGGEMWPPLSLAVGFVFVARDFAQRAVGHWVLAGMAVGGILSWWLADPYVAVASVSAFVVSEVIDWLVFTFSKRPLGGRVLLSSALGTPVDSVIFLGMIGALGWLGVIAMTLSKMAGALAVWWFLRSRRILA